MAVDTDEQAVSGGHEPILFFGGPADGQLRQIQHRLPVTVAEAVGRPWDGPPDEPIRVKHHRYHCTAFVVGGVTYRCWRHEDYPQSAILDQIRAILGLYRLVQGRPVDREGPVPSRQRGPGFQQP